MNKRKNEFDDVDMLNIFCGLLIVVIIIILNYL